MPTVSKICLSALLGAAVVTLQGCGSGGAEPSGPTPAPGTGTSTKPSPATETTTTVPQVTSTTAVVTPNPFCEKPVGPAPPIPAVGQPIGWNPSSQQVGTGQWCAVGKPAPGWNLQDYCGASAQQDNVLRFLSSEDSTVAAASTAAQIKVLTYNLYWWNLFKEGKGRDGMAGKNMAAFAKDMTYDLMGFQECEDVSWPLRDAKAAGMTGNFEPMAWDHAICLVYNSDTFDLITKGQGDVAEDQKAQYYGKRGAMWVRLNHKATGKKVFFMNHHGPLPVNSGGICGAEGTAYNLLQMVAKNAMVGDKIFLVGDFNAWSNDPQGAELSEIGHIDCHFPHVFSNPVVEDVWGIDNFFAACAKPVNKTVMGQGGSDHFALNVVYEI